MYKKIKDALILEKVPGIVCAIACLASVFMGFVLGYVVLDTGETLLAYEDTAAVYQAVTPHLAAVPEYNYQPEQSPTAEYNVPLVDNQTDSYLYVVTILGGYIAIYHAEKYGGGLKEITSTAVGALAPEELERLSIGIKIYSDEALAMILQDYGS